MMQETDAKGSGFRAGGRETRRQRKETRGPRPKKGSPAPARATVRFEEETKETTSQERQQMLGQSDGAVRDSGRADLRGRPAHFVGTGDDSLGAGRAAYGDDLDTLDRRRTEELKLVGEYDSSTINPRRECWFLLETKWLQSWAKFVRGEGPPPGRISNEALVQDDLKTPIEGLVSREDYRGVNPMVWFLYLEMYGKDSAQDLCRYVIDIYEMEVPHKYRRQICEEPMRRAQVEVQKMRWRVEPEEVRRPEKPRLCCCITERVIDCFFMSMFTCCARCRRKCPGWLCCCCYCCCPRRTSATGGRYSRVTTNGEAEDDFYSDSDGDEIDYGAREEDEDLYRLRRDGGAVAAPAIANGVNSTRKSRIERAP